MKRNIVINSQRTAVVVSDYLADAVNQVRLNCIAGDEIFAFDTKLHVAYAWKVVRNGYTLLESEVPLKQFRSFYTIGDSHAIYVSLIQSLIR